MKGPVITEGPDISANNHKMLLFLAAFCVFSAFTLDLNLPERINDSSFDSDEFQHTFNFGNNQNKFGFHKYFTRGMDRHHESLFSQESGLNSHEINLGNFDKELDLDYYNLGHQQAKPPHNLYKYPVTFPNVNYGALNYHYGMPNTYYGVPNSNFKLATHSGSRERYGPLQAYSKPPKSYYEMAKTIYKPFQLYSGSQEDYGPPYGHRTYGSSDESDIHPLLRYLSGQLKMDFSKEDDNLPSIGFGDKSYGPLSRQECSSECCAGYEEVPVCRTQLPKNADTTSTYKTHYTKHYLTTYHTTYLQPYVTSTKYLSKFPHVTKYETKLIPTYVTNYIRQPVYVTKYITEVAYKTEHHMKYQPHYLTQTVHLTAAKCQDELKPAYITVTKKSSIFKTVCPMSMGY